MSEDTKEVMVQERAIKNLIYVIRGQQVMMDSDLAALYQVETKALNRQMKRNIARFPEDFCFQLTEFEFENLRCQFGTSSLENVNYGGRRYLPYVFTEQGIAMLSAVLRSEIAVQVSVRIMKTFVEMRRYLANETFVLEKVNKLESKLLEGDIKRQQFEEKTESRFEQIFTYISEHEEVTQKIFFEGQIYDAFSLLTELISKAEKELVLIDNYVDIGTLNILAKTQPGVKAVVYTAKTTKLSKGDVDRFNQQYPMLEVRHTGAFHDRFLLVDGLYAYHIGASIKDAGKKCFGINKMEDAKIVAGILERLEQETKEK